jgi:DNA-binding XRE family transcriptional regulator
LDWLSFAFFFIFAWKFHPSFGWLSPEIRKDGMNMYYDLVESGKRIKKLRKEKGWTQELLAEKTGVTREYLGKIEKGDRGASIDLLIEFCKCFNSSLDYLVLGKVDNTQIENKKKEVQEIIERLENLF